MILKVIALKTGVDLGYLERIVRSANHRYKTYTIPKRSGGRRIIHHPSKQLKFIQRWLVDNIFLSLPVHPAVYSYRNGRNILDHAKVHALNNFLLRIDFQDFFPSLTGEDIAYLLTVRKTILPFELSENDVATIVSFVCKDNRLTIGSPSSPILSNALLHDFDTYWFEEAMRRGATYSRYADDIYFSSSVPNVLKVVLDDLREDLRTRSHPRLRINDDKTVFTSRKRKRLVTGLVLTPEHKISVGRSNKRIVKSLIYRFSRHELDPGNEGHLRGYLAYLNSVEPTFVQSLRRKFGHELFGLVPPEQEHES